MTRTQSHTKANTQEGSRSRTDGRAYAHASAASAAPCTTAGTITRAHKRALRVWFVVLVLITLCLLSTYGVSNSYAKYTTSGSMQDSARVAKWDVDVSGVSLVSQDVIAGLTNYSASEYSEYGISSSTTSPDSNGYTMSGYSFTVTSTVATETARNLSVSLTLSKNGTATWPSGLTVALYEVSGSGSNKTYTFIAQNTTGAFGNVATVVAGTAFTHEYLVCFKAATSTVANSYDATILAAMDQVD